MSKQREKDLREMDRQLMQMSCAVDAEFILPEERKPTVCCVSWRYGREDPWTRWEVAVDLPLMPDLHEDAFLLSFYAPAEVRALEAIGHDPLEFQWIDLHAEWMIVNNMHPDLPGVSCQSLLDVREALLGIPADAGSKEASRGLVTDVDPHDPWPQWDERRDEIEKYCESDVRDLTEMLRRIMEIRGELKNPRTMQDYLGQAMERGRYQAMLAMAEARGIPIDVPRMMEFQSHRERIIRDCQNDASAKAGTELFKPKRKGDREDPGTALALDQKKIMGLIERVDERMGSGWPRNKPTEAMQLEGKPGNLKRDAATVRNEVRKQDWILEPDEKKALKAYVDYLGETEWLKFFQRNEKSGSWLDRTGSDFRLRPSMGAFGSVTMRNYPKAKHFLPANGKEVRKFLEVPPGELLVQIDYSRQEFAIAAELSKDPAMAEDYISGDPYVALATRCGLWDGKPETRDVFKTVCLGLGYGQGVGGLQAYVSNQLGRDVSRDEAETWHDMYWDSYGVYRHWRQTLEYMYGPGSPLVLPGGIGVWGGKMGALSLQNWPVQATGGEILRSAVLGFSYSPRLRDTLAFTLHDAIYFWSRPHRVEEDVRLAKRHMQLAWVNTMSQEHPDDVENLKKDRLIPSLGLDVTVYGTPGRVAEGQGWEVKGSF